MAIDWVSVEERLPGPGERVLACTDSGVVGEAFYMRAGGICRSYWRWVVDFGFHTAKQLGIIAWMPLPEPYRVGGEE